MHRLPFSRALALILCTIGLAACSDDTSDTASTAPTALAADAYVEQLCTRVTDFRATLDARAEALQGELVEAGADIAAAQQALVGLLDDAAAETQALAEDVQALGTPDVEGGDDIAVGFLNALERAEDLFATAADEIGSLPSDDPTALDDGLTALGENLEDATTEIGSTFDELEQGELQEAAARFDVCDEVFS